MSLSPAQGDEISSWPQRQGEKAACACKSAVQEQQRVTRAKKKGDKKPTDRIGAGATPPRTVRRDLHGKRERETEG